MYLGELRVGEGLMGGQTRDLRETPARPEKDFLF